MSVITQVMIHIGNEEDETINELLSWRYNDYNPSLEFEPRNLNGGLPRHFAGGTKVWSADVYIGCYNCLNEKALIAKMQSIKWENPDDVQLFIMGDDESRFRLVKFI